MLARFKTNALGVFAVGFVVLVLIVGLTAGFGSGPSLNEGSIASIEEVEQGDVSEEQFERALAQAAARQGLREPPDPGTPQYEEVRNAALDDLLLSRWVRGEAAELDIEVSEREIEQELDQVIEQQFGGQQQFDRFLEQQGFSDEEARERIELQLLSQRIQARVIPEDPDISDEAIDDFYDRNVEQFRVPETRDVRTLLNPDRAKAEDALSDLQEDDSPAAWKRVTTELSTDEATSGAGGLRESVIEGQLAPELDTAVFTASEGELLGPVDTEGGFYLAQVQSINPSETQPLDEQTRGQIRQQLATQRQQEIAVAFEAEFLSKWRSRTACDEDFAIERCENAPPADDGCVGDDPDEEIPADPATQEPGELACPAFVAPRSVVPPTSAGLPGAPALPQGPVSPGGQSGFPDGSLPLGGPGAPQLPPGAVPPG